MTRAAPASADREERVKRALANPVYFAEVYFAPYDPNWQTLMPAFAQDMLRFVVSKMARWPHEAGVVMLPPEYMKTTLISQLYPLWLTVRARVFGKLLRGMLLSEEEGMAAGNLSVISWHILNNERLASDFVDGRGNPLVVPDPDLNRWNETEIIVHRPNMVSRDPTWQAKGLDSKGIQGRRLDVVIGDDVVTPRNAGSPALRKRAMDTMDLQVETRVVEHGQILVAGNFNDDKDLLSTLAKQPRYALFKRPSLHRPGNLAEPPQEADLWNEQRSRLTWPENWHRARLKVEWKQKPARFRRIHLLDPRAEQGERLQTGWVTRVPEADLAPLLRYGRMFMGFDPAAGGDTDDLDFSVITVGALTLQHFDILQSFAIRAPLPRVIDALGAIHDAFNRVGGGVQAIGGAKVNMDRVYRSAIAMKRPDLEPKLEDVTVPTMEATKEVRLEGLGPRAQSGWMRVAEPVWTQRTSDAADQHEELTLEEEWREFPYGNHDDRLDSMDIAIRTAEQNALVGEFDFEMAVAEA
jgi:hypothetical protein